MRGAVMSDLTASIVSEHWTTMHNGFHCVGCDWRGNGRDEDFGAATRRHVAEVTEAAMREQIAREIEALRHTQASARAEQIAGATVDETEAWDLAIHHSSRIARGDA